MNTRFFTGWLPQGAERAYAPATREHGPLPRLVFEVMIKDSRGVEFPEKCLVDDAGRIDEWEPLLTAGRAVIVTGEQTARPFAQHGVTKGFVREVRVTGIEFPNRSKAEVPANAANDGEAET